MPLLACAVAAPARAGDARQLGEARRLLDGSYAERAAAVRILAGIDSRDSLRLLRKGIKDTVRDLDDLGRELDDLDDRYEQAIDRLIQYDQSGDLQAYNRWVDIHNAILERYNALAPRLTGLFDVVRSATGAIGGYRSEEAVEALEDGAAHELNPLVRQAYVLALGQEAHRGSIPLLLELLDDRDPRVRSAAVRALQTFSDEERVVERAKALVEDDAWPVRLGAYELVARAPRRVAVPFLVAAVQRERGEIAVAVDDFLHQLTGQSFADEPAAWGGWLKKHAAAIEAGTFVPKPQAPVAHEHRTRASFFTVPIVSERVVFALDVSASMLERDLTPRDTVTQRIMAEHDLAPNRLGVAVAELIRAIRGLPDDAYFNVVAYSDYGKRMSKRLVRSTRSTRRRAERWVLKVRTGFQTNVHDALLESFDDHMSSSGGGYRFENLPDTIVFLTDGVPTRGRLQEPKALLGLVELWNRTCDVAIHCVGIGDDHDARLLSRLARDNHGYYVDIRKGTRTPETRSRALPERPGDERARVLRDAEAGLAHEDWEKRRAACEALGRLGPQAAPFVPALVERLGDHDIDVQKAAREALVRVGPGAVPVLAEALGHASIDAAENAAQALKDLGEAARPAVPALVEVLDGERIYLAVVAAEALADAAEPGDATVIAALRAQAAATRDPTLSAACTRAADRLAAG